jgi:hypothetical protein
MAFWRTRATGRARLRASESTVTPILGHKAIAGTIAVSVIYDRFDRLPEIRAALTVWSDYVEALIRETDEQRDQVRIPLIMITESGDRDHGFRRS